MTATRFGIVPRFAAGQVLSASAHLNALHEVAQGLADDFGGLQLPFAGNGWTNGFAFTRRWRGALRHKADRLAWQYRIHAAGEVKLLLGGQVVPGATQSAVGEYSGTADIAALGLARNAFYEVEVQAAADAQWSLLKLCEVADWSAPAALINFTDGVTPSDAQWQGLSDHAAELARRADAPGHFTLRTTNAPLYGAVTGGIVGPCGGYHLRGVVNHRARYLAYAVSCHPPYWSTGCEAENTGVRFTEARLLVNGMELYRARVGVPEIPQSPVANWSSQPRTFTGVLDLAAVPGLGQGADYLLELVIDWQGCPGDMFAAGGWHYVYEYGELGVNPAGWAALTPWQHGNYVYGNGGVPGVQTLRTDLTLLDGLLHYRNYATPRVEDDGFGLAGVRRRRYLHFRIRKEQNPAFETPVEGQEYTDDTGYPEEATGRLRFYVAGKERTTSLSNPYQTWGTLDLDGVDGLALGVQYFLDDVRYAVEDDEP